jgi:hypothetical protein
MQERHFPKEAKMFDRIMGVITLKAQVYREIADDTTATLQAATIFVIVTIISKFFSGLVEVSGGTAHVSLLGAIISVIIGLIVSLIGWVFTAWVLSFVAGLLEGKTNIGEMLRVTGFVQVFGLVSILTILNLISTALGCLTTPITLAVAVLTLIGYVIGVREAAEFTTGKAIITGIVAVVVNLIVVLVIGGAITALVIAAVAISS